MTGAKPSRPFRAIDTLGGRLRAALADPLHGDRRNNRNMALALVLYTLLWALYGVLAKAGQDVHPDMAELVTWAREPALGYFKHPPLAAWLVAGWFHVFPVADWSYYLLAAMVPSLALWIVWRLSADYLDIDKRILGVALLTLTPFFGVIALKYNVNTVLLPLWVATAFAFLRAFERRSLLWAVLAGLCAAGAMLGKYWSMFLIAGLVLAALLDRRRWSFLLSPVAWIMVVVGAAVLAPHIVWLVQNDYPPFRYVAAAHAPATLLASARSALTYLLGSTAYVALPVILILLAARPDRATVHDMLWPQDPARRLAARAFWLPLLLPMFGAIAFSVEVTSLWSMSAFALLPVVLLSPPRLVVPRIAVDRILTLAIAIPVLMTLAAPVIAIVIQRNGLPPDQTQGSLVAPWVEATWRARVTAPLRIVGGDNAYGTAFYLADKPTAFPDFNKTEAIWMDDARVTRDGMAMVCRVDNAGCVTEAQRRVAADPRGGAPVDVTVARTLAGYSEPPQRYRIWVLPPK
ncbi:MAG: glycosyltransferase family 39 protein [Pseudolabrys sp.]|nr:glycosyltransferase family 39 protein [Pseudolabrys sp.]